MSKTVRIYDNHTDHSGKHIPYVLAQILNPTHAQASVYVSGYTKTDAVEAMNSAKHSFYAKPNHLRMAQGNTSRALADAGLFVEPGVVLVTPMNETGPVLKVDAEGVHLIGKMQRVEGSYAEVFVPAE